MHKDVLTTLEKASCNGTILKLPADTEKPLRYRIEKVLVAAGGRFDARFKGYVFPGPAVAIVEKIQREAHNA